MRDLKYLFAYTVPISVYISFISTGIWTYSAVVYVFLIIPLLDLILGEEKDNIPDESVASLQNKWIFDVMLVFKCSNCIWTIICRHFLQFKQAILILLRRSVLLFQQAFC